MLKSIQKIASVMLCGMLVWATALTVHADFNDEGLADIEQISIFYDLFLQSGVMDELDGAYTLFIPDNGAFDEIPAFVQDYLINNPDLLKRIISYHIVETPQTILTVFAQDDLVTLEGDRLIPNADLNRVNSADLIETDWMIGENQVHIINRLLIPDIVLPPVDPFINFEQINIAATSFYKKQGQI
jgi:uncharacterized surface protein with fasciclin (FAS1) repeats